MYSRAKTDLIQEEEAPSNAGASTVKIPMVPQKKKKSKKNKKALPMPPADQACLKHDSRILVLKLT